MKEVDKRLHDFEIQEIRLEGKDLCWKAVYGGSTKRMIAQGVIELSMCTPPQPAIISRVEVYDLTKENLSSFEMGSSVSETGDKTVEAVILSVEFHTDWKLVVLCRGYYIAEDD